VNLIAKPCKLAPLAVFYVVLVGFAIFPILQNACAAILV
jgi:hypothetical protein